MGLVKGTNCGFVLVAPVNDPAETSGMLDTQAHAFKDTAPIGAVRVTEIGWYCDNATQAADFDVAIYTHNAVNNRPNAFVGSSLNHAKGLNAGWKVVSGLNIDIVEGTIYWIGIQLDNTATATNNNYKALAGEKYDVKFSQTSLPSPWGVSDTSFARLLAVYAVYETGAAAVPKFGSLLNSEKIEQKIGMFAGI